MCVLEVIGVSSRLRLIRKEETLVRVLSTLDLSCEENSVRRKRRVHCLTAQAEVLKSEKGGQFPSPSVSETCRSLSFTY